MSKKSLSATFVKDYNAFTRDWGWRPIENVRFDAVNGLMACHDILEHFPLSGVAPVADEFLAIGAAFFLRVEPGFFDDDPFEDSNYSLTRDFLIPAFTTLFHHIVDEHLMTPPAPNIAAAQIALPRPLEEDIRDALILASGRIAQEFTRSSGRYGTPDPYEKLRRTHYIVDALMGAKGWIRLGYRKAAERYRGLRRISLSEMYRDAAEEMTDLLDRAEPGEMVTLTFTPEDYAHTCTFRPKEENKSKKAKPDKRRHTAGFGTTTQPAVPALVA